MSQLYNKIWNSILPKAVYVIMLITNHLRESDASHHKNEKIGE